MTPRYSPTISSRAITRISPKNRHSCEWLHTLREKIMVRSDDGTSGGGRPMTYLHKTCLHNTCLYNGYDIESFEAGRGLWHARIRRVDQKPLIISGHPFPSLEVGFAWSDQDA